MAHSAPLSSTALQIIDGLRGKGGDTPYLFVTARGKALNGFHADAKNRLDEIAAELNGGVPLAPWTIHDCRRTFASGCARLGVDVVVIEKAINHSTGVLKGVALTYNRYTYQKEVQDAAEMWARHVDNVVRGVETSNVVAMKARR